jgi:hypothetical protein
MAARLLSLSTKLSTMRARLSLKDDTELFKQYSDNPDFKRWLADTVFGMTYGRPLGP